MEPSFNTHFLKPFAAGIFEYQYGQSGFGELFSDRNIAAMQESQWFQPEHANDLRRAREQIFDPAFDRNQGTAKLYALVGRIWGQHIKTNQPPSKDRAKVIAITPQELSGTLTYVNEKLPSYEKEGILPLAALLYGHLSCYGYELPPILVLEEGQGKVVTEGVKSFHWMDVQRQFRDLITELDRGGFWINREVKNLSTVQEAVTFIKLCVYHLPEGWDLIDLLKRIHFGKWREGRKDINATLRSLGMIERWDNGRLGTLMHPLEDRLDYLKSFMGTIKDASDLDPNLQEEMRLNLFQKVQRVLSIVPRLVVEWYFIAKYLKDENRNWLERMQLTSETSFINDLRKRHLDAKKTLLTLPLDEIAMIINDFNQLAPEGQDLDGLFYKAQKSLEYFRKQILTANESVPH